MSIDQTSTFAPRLPPFQTTHCDDDVLVLDRRMLDRTVPFLGIDFDPLSRDALLARVIDGANRVDGFRYCVTPNVDQMVRLASYPQNRTLYQDAWLVVNDSRILELLAGWSGLKLPACPGSDLTQQIFDTAIQKCEPITIIGSDQIVIDALKQRYGLIDVRWHQPPMGLSTNLDAIAEATQFCIANPSRFTFFCVGNPQQEMVAHAVKMTGQATGIGLCVGASLEFLAGTRRRAPAWMGRLRLEWLFRLISEPTILWRRYLVEGPKIFQIWRNWHSHHATQRAATQCKRS